MDWFITTLKAEWPVISAAPLTMATISVVVAALTAIAVWLVARTGYAGKIDALEERLKLADERVTDFREREKSVRRQQP